MKIVDRGAEFLDQVEPGWEERIDPNSLDLSSSCDCVLGQLYRSEHPRMTKTYQAFETKLGELGLGYGAAGRYGFIAWGNARYVNLTTAWRRAILSRRGRA